MPRKKVRTAAAKAQKAQEARWRYLLRNPAFHEDLQKLHRLHRKGADIKKWIDELERIADKWGFLRIPPYVAAMLPFLDFPSGVESFGAEWGLSYSPVATTELKENRFLFSRVDLDHPLEDLLPLIEKELRYVYQSRPRRRKRFDKVDFQLR